MDRSARLSDMEGRRLVLPVNHSVNHQQKGILGILLYFVFWSTFCLDHVEGTTSCAQKSTSYSLPVASLCYKTSASAVRVVLDGFLTYDSLTTICECTLTSSQSTNVSFIALSNIQPNGANCVSSVRVNIEGKTVFIISCEVSGTVPVSTTQTVIIKFEKPSVKYDSNYCILLSSVDNPNAVLSLNCDGDLNIPPSSSTSTTTTPLPTTQTTTTTTTPAPTTTTTTTPAPTTTTPTTTTPTTTTKPTTTTTTTTTQQPTMTTTSTMAPTTTSTTTTVSTTTMPSTGVPSTYSPTTKSSVTRQTTDQSKSFASTSSAWSYVIPAIGGGLILIIAIVMAVCYNHRKKRSNLYQNTNGLFAYENKLNSPYSRSYAYEEGPEMTSSISASSHIKAIIVDDVRDDMSVSTNVSEGTFVRHSVRQPISNEMPVYAVVNKSLDANNPPPDVMPAEDDVPVSQSKQTTDVDVIY